MKIVKSKRIMKISKSTPLKYILLQFQYTHVLGIKNTNSVKFIENNKLIIVKSYFKLYSIEANT